MTPTSRPPQPLVLLHVPRRSERTDGLVRGLRQYLATHNRWTLVVSEDHALEQGELTLPAGDPIGVISDRPTPALVAACQSRQIPLVDVTDLPKIPGVPKIKPDNFAVGRMAAADLAARGFERFAFCGYASEAWSRDRRDGFCEKLAAMGKECTVFEVVPHWLAPAGALEAQVADLARFLRTLRRPVAVLAAMDYLATQVLAAARLLDLAVPGDLAILGVNNDQANERPGLSSIALNDFQTGYFGGVVVDQALIGRGFVEGIDIQLDPAGVITRESTDVIAGHDADFSKAIAFIRENACRGIKVEEVASVSLISRDRLEKGLRKVLGRSPQQEIDRVRLVRIQQLLAGTRLSLRDIAEQTGFKHVEHFCVFFKRLAGETPRRYQRQLLQDRLQLAKVG